MEHLIEIRLFTPEFRERYFGVLGCNVGVEYPPEVRTGKATLHRFCFMPEDIRPGGPTRNFALDEEYECIKDLRGLDINAEIEWFLRMYRADLAEIAAYLDTDAGHVHWGLVQWVS